MPSVLYVIKQKGFWVSLGLKKEQAWLRYDFTSLQFHDDSTFDANVLMGWNQTVLPGYEGEVCSVILLTITYWLKKVLSHNQEAGISYGSSVFTGMVAMSVRICQNPKYLVVKYSNRL